MTHPLASEMKQLVEWPTHSGGRTIDHVYVSKNVKVNIVRYSPYYSDHDALCIQLEDHEMEAS